MTDDVPGGEPALYEAQSEAGPAELDQGRPSLASCVRPAKSVLERAARERFRHEEKDESTEPSVGFPDTGRLLVGRNGVLEIHGELLEGGGVR